MRAVEVINELSQLLLSLSQNNKNIVNVPPPNTLYKLSTKTPCVVTYHPRLPDISKILRDLHPILESLERSKNAIKSVKLVAFRKPKSLGDYLVCAKVDNRVLKNCY